MRPVRGEWRGKTEFEAVPAAAIAGGCEIGAVVVGERGPKHDAVDDDLDRHRQVRIRGVAGPVSDQPCLRSVEPALQRASRDRDAAALGEPPPHRLDLRGVVEARRAEGPAQRFLAGIENGELDGVAGTSAGYRNRQRSRPSVTITSWLSSLTWKYATARPPRTARLRRR